MVSLCRDASLQAQPLTSDLLLALAQKSFSYTIDENDLMLYKHLCEEVVDGYFLPMSHIDICNWRFLFDSLYPRIEFALVPKRTSSEFAIGLEGHKTVRHYTHTLLANFFLIPVVDICLAAAKISNFGISREPRTDEQKNRYTSLVQQCNLKISQLLDVVQICKENLNIGQEPAKDESNERESNARSARGSIGNPFIFMDMLSKRFHAFDWESITSLPCLNLFYFPGVYVMPKFWSTIVWRVLHLLAEAVSKRRNVVGLDAYKRLLVRHLSSMLPCSSCADEWATLMGDAQVLDMIDSADCERLPLLMNHLHERVNLRAGGERYDTRTYNERDKVLYDACLSCLSPVTGSNKDDIGTQPAP
jgi:hypothetical protein